MSRIALLDELPEDIKVEVILADAGNVGRLGGGLVEAPHHGNRAPHAPVCRTPRGAVPLDDDLGEGLRENEVLGRALVLLSQEDVLEAHVLADADGHAEQEVDLIVVELEQRHCSLEAARRGDLGVDRPAGQSLRLAEPRKSPEK